MVNDEKGIYSVMLMASASGTLLPPVIYVPFEKRMPLDIIQSSPGEWLLGRAGNTYLTAQTFYDYIVETFYPYILKQNIKTPIILFLDADKCHLTLEVGIFCKEHGIVLIILPSSCPHYKQPLDTYGFHPLKEYYEKEVLNWKLCHNGASVLPKKEFTPLLKAALDKVDLEAIKNGFQKCGLQPFDLNAVYKFVNVFMEYQDIVDV